MSQMFDDPDEIVVFTEPDGRQWSYDPRFVPTSEDDEDSYAKWTVAQLDEELTSRGLDTEGKKADKVARLEADDAENADNGS